MDGYREIGRLGTAARVLGGVTFIAVPLAVHGIGWWDVAGALVVLPLVAMVVAELLGVGRSRAGRGRALVVVGSVIAIATALTFVTPLDGVAIWSFFGVSMLVAALRGYGGCEVLAISQALFGRRYRVHCLLYAPIDAREIAR